MVSVTSALRYHPRYQSRSFLDVHPWSDSTLDEAVTTNQCEHVLGSQKKHRYVSFEYAQQIFGLRSIANEVG